jgi:hypothetical protein
VSENIKAERIQDYRWIAFYGTLAALILLDVVLILRMLIPLAHAENRSRPHHAAAQLASKDVKPSPFAGGKILTKSARARVETRSTMAALVEARFRN